MADGPTKMALSVKFKVDDIFLWQPFSKIVLLVKRNNEWLVQTLTEWANASCVKKSTILRESTGVIARWNMNGLNSLNEQYCNVIFSY